MWNPLVNDFPETVHGFRSMLAVKYLLHLEQEYESRYCRGLKYIRDLNRGGYGCKKFMAKPTREKLKNSQHPVSKGGGGVNFTQPIHEPCGGPYCPRHQKQNMGQQAHVSEAQDVQDVSKPRRPSGL
nr:movement protein [East African cassava mosaic Cameroon virus]